MTLGSQHAHLPGVPTCRASCRAWSLKIHKVVR
jgi:hypothetical protein